VRRVAGAAAAEQRHLERRVEEVGDALLVALGRRAEQPHQEEERHHRRHEIGVRDLPGAAVLVVAAFPDALDDDGLELLGVTCHFSGSSTRRTRARAAGGRFPPCPPGLA
jgi:hypothetical protein